MTRFPYEPLAGLELLRQGKTRDTFILPRHPDKLLIVATNRLSTHDIVHKSEIPHKGEVLTAINVHWLADVLGGKKGVPNHLVAFGSGIWPFMPLPKREYPPDLSTHAIVVQKLRIPQIEFVFRNFLAGSLFHKFYAQGVPNPYGIELPKGLPVMHAFDQPLFTPTTKSEIGDVELDSEEIFERHKKEVQYLEFVMHMVRRRLNKVGIELIDTKFEIGYDATGKILLADEVATPDSSRMCDLLDVKVGVEPPWLDKQVARDAAIRKWGDDPRKPLSFEKEEVGVLSRGYFALCERITGKSLAAFQRDRLL